jgi:hypothetical protein
MRTLTGLTSVCRFSLFCRDLQRDHLQKRLAIDQPTHGCGELAARQLDCKCVCGAMVFTCIEHAPVCGGKVKSFAKPAKGIGC